MAYTKIMIRDSIEITWGSDCLDWMADCYNRRNSHIGTIKLTQKGKKYHALFEIRDYAEHVELDLESSALNEARKEAVSFLKRICKEGK